MKALVLLGLTLAIEIHNRGYELMGVGVLLIRRGRYETPQQFFSFGPVPTKRAEANRIEELAEDVLACY